jgi:hypothetical protein
MTVLRLTLDTNQLDEHQIERLRAAVSIPHEFAYVTVSARERGPGFLIELKVVSETGVWGESRWGGAVWGGPIAELLVLDESRLGDAVLAADGHVDVLETALKIISNGSFPRSGERESLSAGQRRQLRDAMMFEAHVRRRRHVLVTEDARGFIRDGRRDRLERLGETRVLTPDELEELAASLRLSELVREGP